MAMTDKRTLHLPGRRALSSTRLSGIFLLAPALALTACAVQPDEKTLTLYSPAAAPNPMWAANVAIAAQLMACDIGLSVTATAVALPDAINNLDAVGDKRFELPIITTVDFETARAGSGPEWHPYPNAHPDLKFAASLYEVGIGMMVFGGDIKTPADLAGKRIAVPRRPSSLRVMLETLLRDGWGVLDDVTLVDMPPSHVIPAIDAGEIDATTWNMLIEREGSLQPMLPPLQAMGGRWLSVDTAAIARINARGDVRTEAVSVPVESSGASADVLSFRQGLAVWDETPDLAVRNTLSCLARTRPPAWMADWPALTAGMMHPAARKFYQNKN